MKKSNYLSIAVLLLLGFNLKGQTNELNVKPIVLPSLDNQSVIIYEFDDKRNYLVEGSNHGNMIIHKTDSNLKSLKSYTFLSKDESEKEEFGNGRLIYLKNKVYLTRDFPNKKTKTRVLKVRPFNLEKFVPEGEWSSISEYNEKEESRFLPMASPGFQKTAIATCTSPEIMDVKQKVSVSVYDENLKVVWSTVHTMPFEAFRATMSWCGVDDAGNFCALTRVFNTEYKRGYFADAEDDKDNFTWHMIVINNNGKNLIDYPINLKGKSCKRISFTFDKKGNVIVAGFYSEKKVYTPKTIGYFYFLLDINSKNIKANVVQSFDIDFITEGLKEKEATKLKKKFKEGDKEDVGFPYLELLRLKTFDDGSTIMIGEHIKVYNLTNSGKSYNYKSYEYGDFIILKCDSLGKFLYNAKIGKKQTSINDGAYYISASIIMNKENVKFIYNDLTENLSKTKSNEMKEFKARFEGGIDLVGTSSANQNIVLATIDNAGKITKQSIFNDRKTGEMIVPKSTIEFGSSKFILRLETKKESRDLMYIDNNPNSK